MTHRNTDTEAAGSPGCPRFPKQRGWGWVQPLSPPPARPQHSPPASPALAWDPRSSPFRGRSHLGPAAPLTMNRKKYKCHRTPDAAQLPLYINKGGVKAV